MRSNSENASVPPVRLKAIEIGGIGSYLRPARLEIRPLTILCGTNGGGKSTWIRTLEVLKESVSKNWLPFGLDLSQVHDPNREPAIVGDDFTSVGSQDLGDPPACLLDSWQLDSRADRSSGSDAGDVPFIKVEPLAMDEVGVECGKRRFSKGVSPAGANATEKVVYSRKNLFSFGLRAKPAPCISRGSLHNWIPRPKS